MVAVAGIIQYFFIIETDNLLKPKKQRWDSCNAVKPIEFSGCQHEIASRYESDLAGYSAVAEWIPQRFARKAFSY
jgi:hypothetical protein